MKNISEVKFQETPRIFRTEVPNIVFELLQAEEISTSDFILYSVYRRIAGEQGACWVGTRGLSEKTGLSTPTITKSKINLARPFAALNGKSLIDITPCDHEKQIADTVTINDIWIDNHEYFKNKLTCVKRRYGGVQKEDTGVCKNTTQKKEPYKKEPEKKIIIPPSSEPEPPVASQIDDDDLNLSVREVDKEGDVVVTKTNGSRLTMTSSVIFRHFSKLPHIPTPVLQEAIKRLRAQAGPINNILKYLEHTCNSILEGQKASIKPKESVVQNSKIAVYSPGTPAKPTITWAEAERRYNEKLKAKNERGIDIPF